MIQTKGGEDIWTQKGGKNISRQKSVHQGAS
jgi:hypothetical protein